MTEPTAAETATSDASRRAAARRCLGLWATPAPIAVAAEDQLTFQVCFPLVAHAMNQVATALEIYDRFPYVAASCARIALEHALTAEWVLLTDDGARHLLRVMDHQRLVRAKEFSAAVGDPVELADDVAAEYAPGDQRSWNLKAVFERFGDQSPFYDLYRDLSQAAHPSLGTIQAHCGWEGRTPTRQLDRGGRLHPSLSTSETLGFAAVLAIDVFERLREGDTRIDQVEAIAAAAGLPSELISSDSGPDLRPKPAGPIPPDGDQR